MLNLRLCDLGLKIEGTALERRIEQLYAELKHRGLRFRPHFWLSTEWFCPDGVPGVGIPFYLAHPRLMRLEHRQMLEVEGGNRDWCMRILRHEAGHAINNAYRLHHRRRWQRVFGHATDPYPEYYRPRPFSLDYVQHLDYWYAQSHPAEDFAETFAVWLKSPSQWRRRYKGWPALRKLEYVDALMREVAAQRQAVRSRERMDPLHEMQVTLKKHYEEKQALYGKFFPDFYDDDLRRVFADPSLARRGESAASFLRRMQPAIRRAVATWTSQHAYSIDLVLRQMIVRCRELRLRAIRPDQELKQDATIMLAVQTMKFLHRGPHRLML